MVAEWRVRHGDGSWRFLQSIVTNLIHEPSVGGLVLNSRDITDQKDLEEQLRHQAFHDTLTGLANRALFSEHLEQAVRRRGRIGGGLALFFIDLDSFKAVNDLHGHSLGDDVLKQAAQRLRTTLRDADAIARLRRLAVEPGDLPNAVEWGSVAEGAVGASLVVVADPVWQ
jgi:predicted signal transduction protein with EAL and GGDEF domain